MGPLKHHSNTLWASFFTELRLQVYSLQGFLFFKKQTFSSVFLHVLVVGLLSGVARMELCDTARTPDILQWTVNSSLRTFHSHLQLHESGVRMGTKTKRMTNIQIERHQHRRTNREAGRQIDRQKDRQLDRGCVSVAGEQWEQSRDVEGEGVQGLSGQVREQE